MIFEASDYEHAMNQPVPTSMLGMQMTLKSARLKSLVDLLPIKVAICPCAPRGVHPTVLTGPEGQSYIEEASLNTRLTRPRALMPRVCGSHI